MHAFPWALAKYQIGLTINVHAIYMNPTNN